MHLLSNLHNFLVLALSERAPLSHWCLLIPIANLASHSPECQKPPATRLPLHPLHLPSHGSRAGRYQPLHMQKVPFNNGKSLLVVLVDPLIDLAMIVDSLQQRLNLVLHIILKGLQTSLFLKEF